MATPRKKIAPVAAVPSIDEIEPVRIGKKTEPVEMVTVFEWDGREYQIPKNIPVGLTLRFQRTMRKQGQAQATQAFIEELLGDDAIAALESSDATWDDIRRVYEIVSTLAFGSMTESAKAASGN